MKRLKFIQSISAMIMAIPLLSFDIFSAKEKECYTDPDVQGPFFRDGAPTRLNLAKGYKGDGDSLLVSGFVFGGDCNTPLINAQIDIWHASPTGEYDLNSDKYLFRGTLFTDKKGCYHYETLVPKGYKDGGLDRPKHIHYRVTANDHKTLVTQLYFTGDEKLENDPFVRMNDGYRRVKTPQKTDVGGYEMTFDINLRPKK